MEPRNNAVMSLNHKTVPSLGKATVHRIGTDMRMSAPATSSPNGLPVPGIHRRRRPRMPRNAGIDNLAADRPGTDLLRKGPFMKTSAGLSSGNTQERRA